LDPEAGLDPAARLALEDAYDHLHPTIQRWIMEQGWEELREIQARTIIAVLKGNRDIVIAASTAAGKTEAAFLPVLTRVEERKRHGFSVLGISPLKALINDQFRRLEGLCDRLGIPLVKWHGDAPQAAKQRARVNPRGIALMTPESIEAMLVRHPKDAKAMLSAAEFIVIDELHAFLHGPRGLHLASLLRRIDALSLRPPRRIALSATIGDLAEAAAWLRPSAAQNVEILQAKSDAPELRLQIRGYVEPADLADPNHAGSAPAADGSDEDAVESRVALDDIADHLFATLRGTNNLVFGGSRSTVEAAADRLRLCSEKLGVPNEFFPHHGSLSRFLREALEDRLKDGTLPTTGISTSTLELGIDIGSVKSVAQIGAPRSLASLRQRIGRTGRRRGTPSILRIYLREPRIWSTSSVIDRLRPNTIRSVAVIRLLLENFVEPAGEAPEVASTLIHQILSVITERGGIRGRPLYDLLCGAGPFASVSVPQFVGLLKHLASVEIGLIEQATDGTIMLAAKGEAIVHSYRFYAAFETGVEWRLVASGLTLGTLPISFPLCRDSLVVFGGRRWIVKDLDERTNTLFVAPHPEGVVPRFESADGERLHDRVAAEMRNVYLSADEPVYLDATARTLLAEGRQTFRDQGLDRRHVLEEAGDVHVFLWRGSQTTAVFGAAATLAGFRGRVHELGLTLARTRVAKVLEWLQGLAEEQPMDADCIASVVANIASGKFREYVPEGLARALWAEQNSRAINAISHVARDLRGGNDL